MPLVTTASLYRRALGEGFAVAAFNANNPMVLRAVVEAARGERAPVILMFEPAERSWFGPRYLRSLVRAALDETDCDVVLHLDHGDGYESCRDCIDEGFTSVMIDGSGLPLEENMALTSRVVEYAHRHGVVVEAELGCLRPLPEEGGVPATGGGLTVPEEAACFVAKTGCDSLAVAVGTSHGIHKFVGEPRLDFARLAAIEVVLPDYPLVLHGASSVAPELVATCRAHGALLPGAQGVPEWMVVQAARRNVCKVNIDTDLRLAMTAALRRHLAEHPSNIDPEQYLGAAAEEVGSLVRHKIRLLRPVGPAGPAP